MNIRRSQDRGTTKLDWLDGRHSFSFGYYQDPAHMGFRSLRVINEDRIAPGGGFGTHPHRDMEIVTWVLSGELKHQDSLGNGSVIRPGELQLMRAGSGIRHSEFNASATEPVHLLQIWITPRVQGLTPGYEQKTFGEAARKNRLCLLVSPDGREGSAKIEQDAEVYVSNLDAGKGLDFEVKAGRGVWVQVSRGELEIQGEKLKAGDGVSFEEAVTIHLKALKDSQFLIFDLA